MHGTRDVTIRVVPTAVLVCLDTAQLVCIVDVDGLGFCIKRRSVRILLLLDVVVPAIPHPSRLGSQQRYLSLVSHVHGIRAHKVEHEVHLIILVALLNNRLASYVAAGAL